MEEIDLLKDLYDEYKNKYYDNEVVLGDGCANAKIVLIGEAPGKDEVLLGRPFVGAAGKHLQNFLNILELKREELFITNAIKFRLFKLNDKTGRKVNRPATKKEIADNRTYLEAELKIIKPTIITTLGNVPLEAILGKKAPKIGEVHGQVLEYRLAEVKYMLFPLYHPASIIYNRSLASTYENDLIMLKNVINSSNTM